MRAGIGELSEHQRRARSRRRRAWLCVPIVVGLAIGAGLSHHEGISDDLAARSRATLHAAGYDGVQVKFSGREAQVRGTVPRPVDLLAVEALIEGQRGVRWADMRAVVIVAPPSTPAAPGTSEE